MQEVGVRSVLLMQVPHCIVVEQRSRKTMSRYEMALVQA
jgi:hypothetical protein